MVGKLHGWRRKWFKGTVTLATICPGACHPRATIIYPTPEDETTQTKSSPVNKNLIAPINQDCTLDSAAGST